MSSIAQEARAHLLTIITARAPGLPLTKALPRVAALLDFPLRRTQAIWNFEARRIDADEMAVMERELAAISRRALTTELHAHANRLEYYAARLAASDPDSNRAEIDELRRLARGARSVFDQSRSPRLNDPDEGGGR